MKYLDPTSLFNTIDNVSEALLFNFEIDNAEKSAIADFIVGQHNQPRAYANTFALTESDWGNEFVLFTGEKIKSGAGKSHMAGEEASRILRKLEINTEKVISVLQDADVSLQDRIKESLINPRYEYGMYCCNSCSCGLWLNLSSGGLNNNTKLLVAGLDYLKRFRDGKGRWKGFPYYYTLYILNEIKPDLAKEELRYAAKTIEQEPKRNQDKGTKYILRRDFIRNQILEKVNRN